MIAVAGAVGLAVGLTLTSGPGPARADKVLIDRVEARASVLPGQTRVRALVSVTQTGGDVVEAARDDKTKATSLKVKVGGSSPPFLLGAFEHAEVELALIIAIPTTLDFHDDFEAMKDAIDVEVFAALVAMGPRVRVQVIGYGSEITGSKGLLRAADARKALADLSIEGGDEQVDLAEVVGRGVKLAGAQLKKPKNKDAITRAAVLLVSKGVPVLSDEIKAAITKVGQQAAKAQVRIHTVGYSPSPDGKYHAVRPLLALGELSRQSNGTFRWVKTEGGWRAAVGQVAQEIGRQHVVTFFATAEELDGKKLTVSLPLGTTTLSSDPVTIGAPKCGADACEASAYCVKAQCVTRSIESKSVVGKVLLFGGLGIGALVVLFGGIALVGRRRRGVAGARSNPGPAYPGPAAPLPGAVAPHVPPVAAAVQPPAGGPVLMILTGPAAGTRLPVRHGLSVGKAAGNDLDLAHDGYASSNHAQIVFEGGGWMVYDRNSTNGTFSNGVRITHTRLDHGMTIRFGSTEVRFSAS